MKTPFITTLTVSFMFLTGIFFSCSKTEEEVPANVNISFVLPSENETYSSHDTVSIEADITADVSMHGYKIFLHYNSGINPDLLIDKHTHGKIIYVRNKWVIPENTTPGFVDIEVIALIDHEGKTLSSKRRINIK